jgi:hypothetical protein
VSHNTEPNTDNPNGTNNSSCPNHPPPQLPWDDPNRDPSLPSDDECPPQFTEPPEEGFDTTQEANTHTSNKQHPKMPHQIRTRLIQHHRLLRKQRRTFIAYHQNASIKQNTFNTFTLTPSAPSAGTDSTHNTFTLGPILFCKICGATKATSQGLSLSRICRGWAPPGTQAHVKSLLRGRPSQFYRNLLHQAATPRKRLHTKTTPTPKLIIPRHLKYCPPTPPAPTRISLTRSTVLGNHIGDHPIEGTDDATLNDTDDTNHPHPNFTTHKATLKEPRTLQQSPHHHRDNPSPTQTTFQPYPIEESLTPTSSPHDSEVFFTPRSTQDNCTIPTNNEPTVTTHKVSVEEGHPQIPRQRQRRQHPQIPQRSHPPNPK